MAAGPVSPPTRNPLQGTPVHQGLLGQTGGVRGKMDTEGKLRHFPSDRSGNRSRAAKQLVQGPKMLLRLPQCSPRSRPTCAKAGPGAQRRLDTFPGSPSRPGQNWASAQAPRVTNTLSGATPGPLHSPPPPGAQVSPLLIPVSSRTEIKMQRKRGGKARRRRRGRGGGSRREAEVRARGCRAARRGLTPPWSRK